MRLSYTKSIDELGGAPTGPILKQPAACLNHWQTPWGIFEPAPGHYQGTEEVDRRLLGYIVVRRWGDFVLYTQIMGHGDHLESGALIHLHHNVMRWLLDSRSPDVNGVRWVMYGGAENGGPGLHEWKRRESFEKHDVVLYGGLRLND